MSSFQTFDVTANDLEGVIANCLQKVPRDTGGVEMIVTIDVLSNIHQPLSIATPPISAYSYYAEKLRLYGYEYLKIRMEDANAISIIRAVLTCRRIMKNCPYCGQFVIEWWEHVKSCGGERCEGCLNLKDGSVDHVNCVLKTYRCAVCNEAFATGNARKAHQIRCGSSSGTPRTHLHSSALNHAYEIHALVLEGKSPDFEGTLLNCIPRVRQCLLKYAAKKHSSLKFSLGIEVAMKKLIESPTHVMSAQTHMTTVMAGADPLEGVQMHVDWLLERIAQYISNGSGLIVEGIQSFTVHIAMYNPVGGSSYLKLHPDLEHKKSIVNIENPDNKCFMWAICCAIRLPDKLRNKHLISKYKDQAANFKHCGASYPMDPFSKKIPQIEDANDLVVNIFRYHDRDGLVPVRISNRPKGPRTTEAHLLIIDEENGPGQHYACITDLSKLLSSLAPIRRRNKTHWCIRCLSAFKSLDNLNKHSELCVLFRPQRTEMPEPGEKMSFLDYGNTIPAPCWVTVDFETTNEPVHPDFQGSNTQTLTNMKAISYAIKVNSDYPQYDLPIEVYVGEDAAMNFVMRLDEIYSDLKPLLTSDEPPTPLTIEENTRQHGSPCCWICEKPFDRMSETPVIDHSHYPLLPGQTSNYLGPAHSSCNLRRRQDVHLPVILHNLYGFDLHLFFRELCAHYAESLESFIIIPKTSERYISLTTPQFKFVDSLKHLTASLENLVEGTSPSDMKQLRAFCEQYWPDSVDAKFQLLNRKMVFPYSYLTSIERLQDRVPDRAAFRNTLTESEVTDEDWAYVVTLVQEFNLQTMRDMIILYNCVDVLLLSDVWAVYRKRCLADYGLEPARYIGAPSLTWAAALKTSRVELDLLSDVSMYNMFESGIRGGISVISKRYAKANLPGQPDYDPTKPITHLQFWDSNNLYGEGQMCPLPHSNFQWEKKPEDFTSSRIMSMDVNSPRGYVLEVDISVPPELHDILNDYPIIPAKMEINDTMISPFSKTVREMRGFPTSFKTEKFAPSFFPQRKYVVHLANLIFYLSIGAVLEKVHRVISFEQKAFFKDYIQKLAENRRCATCEFIAGWYKMLANALFGKTLQSARDYMNFILIQHLRQHQYQIRKPELKRFTIFDENLVGVETMKKIIKLDRPIYIGFAILERSKLVMYKFFYHVLKPTFPSLKLLLTDTDSFLVELHTDDLVRDLKSIASHFDFSRYPKDHPLHSDENKGVPGKFKSEVDARAILDFVGLRSKSYSLLLEDGTTKSAAAGTTKDIARLKLNHQKYRDTLQYLRDFHVTQKTIRSKNHHMMMVSTHRVALSAYDDKRWIMDDGVNTKAYGHVDLSS